MIIKENNGLELNVYDLSSSAGDSKKNAIYKEQHYGDKLLFLRSIFFSTFLPQGFPESVSPDYIEYQLWDSVQAFCSGIMGNLATHAVLKGAGVGDINATALAATITWLLKDGTGMLGRIYFTWWKGSKLDADCKKWRIFADVINDVAIVLEMCSANSKLFYTPIICISGLAKSIVGVAGGATRAAVAQHQARRNNMADISAKDGCQETLVNLSSLICSLMLLPVLTNSASLVWTIFLVLTLLHVFSNLKAVRSLAIQTLNTNRSKLLVETYLQENRVEDLEVINKKEPLWFETNDINIRMGVSISELSAPEDIPSLRLIFMSSAYLLLLSRDNRRKKVNISLLLLSESDARTQVEAMFHACILHYVLVHPNQKYLQHLGEACHKYVGGYNNPLECIQLSYVASQEMFPRFYKEAAELGWQVQSGIIGCDEWRVDLLET